MAEAEARALAALTRHPVPPSWVARYIWPDHRMTGQGAGFAAIRVLKRLEAKGLARWGSDPRLSKPEAHHRGWMRS